MPRIISHGLYQGSIIIAFVGVALLRFGPPFWGWVGFYAVIVAIAGAYIAGRAFNPAPGD